MLPTENIGVVKYSGVFLTCFGDLEEKCFHAMPEHVLFYLYSGEQVIEDRNRTTTISAGECAFIRRDHKLAMNKYSKNGLPYKSITLSFNRGVIKDVYNKMKKSELPLNVQISDDYVFKIKPSADITSLFTSLTPYFDLNQVPSDNVVYLKLMEAIYALLNNSETFYPILFDFADPWKIDILEFMNQNYMDELTMEEMAAYTGRSLATFKRDFKKVSTISPQKWLIRRRLEAAYQKLKEGRKIQDVYAEVGFKNPSHFSTAFKKQYNLPPSEV